MKEFQNKDVMMEMKKELLKKRLLKLHVLMKILN